MAETARTPTELRRRKRRSELWIVGGVLVVLAGALTYAARDLWTTPAGDAVPVAKPPLGSELRAERQAKPAPGLGESADADSEMVDDDGRTLWTSPTHGPPLDLAYLPPGIEIVLALRPAELLAHPEGEKVIAALGPLGQFGIGYALQKVPYAIHFNRIKRLTIGCRFSSTSQWDITVVAVVPHEKSSEGSKPLEHVEERHGGVITGSNAFYIFERPEGHVLVGTLGSTMSELVRLNGQTPPLSRPMGRLLSHTDSSRQFTLLVQPKLLASDSRNVFQGTMQQLLRPLESFLGDDVAAASLSLHWDEDFFIELVAVPTLDSSPEKMSDELATRVNELPERVEEFELGLAASPYSRRVVARLPEMVRRLASYTRHGFDRDAAVLRCYLPVTAGHNLIMGAELALAESHAKAGKHAGVLPVAAATSQDSFAKRLQKKTSLRFAREELEAALDMLAADVGVKIVIRGQDLQLDGITRNQLFAIDMADRSGEEILVEILRRANPDKLAAGPADPRQKLVYVVGPEAIFITTRAKAAERGEPLPAVFQPAP